MARLDRLQPVKEVAQAAACIGREFDLSLLTDILEFPADALIGALNRLIEADMMIGRGAPPEATYMFRHALVRDAAYESLLRSKRHHIHGRIAAVLETHENPTEELIAYHATQAGQRERAIAWWQKAATTAISRPAFKEAIAHLNHAIQLTEELGDESPWPETRLGLLMVLGQASMAARGYGHADTVAAFSAARELSTTMDNKPYRFTITYGLWVATYLRGDQDRALNIAQEMLGWAEQDKKTSHMISGLRSLAISQMIAGSPGEAEASFEAANELSDAKPILPHDRRVAVAQRFAADPELGTRFHYGLTLWSLGKIAQARKQTLDALAEARSLEHVHTLAHALTHASIAAVLERDTEQALALASETVTFAEEYDLQMWNGYGSILQAAALALRGDDVGSVPIMEIGFERMRRSQTGCMVPFHHALHARTLARIGEFDKAQVHADLVRQEIRTGSERYLWPECHRLLGDYLRLCGASLDDVEAQYQKAYDLARQQGAISWECCAAISLAEIWKDRDDRNQARNLLSLQVSRFDKDVHWPAYDDAVRLLKALG
jgi:tetratricopeptide (TPR) repeat protein